MSNATHEQSRGDDRPLFPGRATLTVGHAILAVGLVVWLLPSLAWLCGCGAGTVALLALFGPVGAGAVLCGWLEIKGRGE